MNEERQSVADYLRDVAQKIENGFAFDFEFRWALGKKALASLHVSPVGREDLLEYDERRFASIPHVSEVCMAAGSALIHADIVKLNHELAVAESLVTGAALDQFTTAVKGTNVGRP